MKDPALLWYFSDWFSGTATLTRHQKGAYMDLLSVQFNQGKLTLDEIKTVLGSDFGSSWPALQKKFKFEDNLYFNERLQQEKDKRANYTESRRKNAKHMPKHMEDINIDINTNSNTVLPLWLNKKAWEAWIQHRKEKKKPLTPTTIRMQLRLLEENKEDHVQIIKNSITNGWTGLFEIKNNVTRKPSRYVEPSDSAEINERRRILTSQSETLASNFKI